MDSLVDEAGPVREGEELDVPRLEKYLLEHLPGTEGPLTVEQFPGGFSNLTYLLLLGSREFVLRRPPFGNPVKSAHDMSREYRVLSKLCEVYEPAPRPYLHCEDRDVLGDEFYLLERRRGIVLRGPVPPPPLKGNPALARRMCEAFIDNLARLHTLDYRAAGLGDLGKPEGYVERQVNGWIKRYEKARTDDYPEMEKLTTWFAENRPGASVPGLIHNDYKFDNLMLDPEDLTRIIAVLDWEMATVGDPLMDLGTTLAYWVQASDSREKQEGITTPEVLTSSMTRRDLLSRYKDQTGFEVGHFLFYYSFGLYKIAVIVQQIYARFARGLTTDERFADLNVRVQSLARTATRAIESGEI